MIKVTNKINRTIVTLMSFSAMLASCNSSASSDFSHSKSLSSGIASSIELIKHDLRSEELMTLDYSKSQNVIDTSSFEGEVVMIANKNADRTSTGFVNKDGKLSLAKVALSFFLCGDLYSEKTDVSFITDKGHEYIHSARIVTKAISKPYEILEAFKENSTLDAYFILNNDIDCDGMDPVRMFSSKIDRPVSSWDPMTYDLNIGFRGIFDGQGHTISNMTTSNGYNILGGLFGQSCEGSVIKNLALTDFTSDKYSALFGESSGFSGILENVVITSSSSCPTDNYRMFWRIEPTAIIRNVIACGFTDMSYSYEDGTIENLYGVVAHENNKYNAYEYARFDTESEMINSLKQENVFASNEFIHFDEDAGELYFGGNLVLPH